MEIHAQLDVPTKLFSPASSSFSRIPNLNVHPYDVSVPGFLPVVSQAAVHAAILTAAGCRCEIPPTSRFERKHYFYADLPLGYQITQQRWPLARNGMLVCRKRTSIQGNKTSRSKQTSPSPSKGRDDNYQPFVTVRVDRIQLEQDSGKTIFVHRPSTLDNQQLQHSSSSRVDFNRAGCALVEIVLRPDIRSANDAGTVLQSLRDLLLHLGTCNGRMEEGSLRCDLNVSIVPWMEDMTNPVSGESNGTYRVEVKNLNSIREVMDAAAHEAIRQAQNYQNGTSPKEKETRTWDVASGSTTLLRSKEGDVEYRFLPEPDIPPLVLNEDILDGMSLEAFIATRMPTLPDEIIHQLMTEYGLSEEIAMILCGDPKTVTFYKDAVRVAEQGLGGRTKELSKTVSNWICNDLFSLVKESEDDEELPSMKYSTVTASQLGELIILLEKGTITTPMGKRILASMFHEEIGKMPKDIAKEKGFKVITEMDTLRQLCRQVVMDAKYSEQIRQYKSGGKAVYRIKQFFVGKLMSISKGNVHPELVQDALDEILKEVASDVNV
jgi:aspartyl-tRNA(Asn)/glutamyl-tRNA(Gln) amidotransferase subunit B